MVTPVDRSILKHLQYFSIRVLHFTVYKSLQQRKLLIKELKRTVDVHVQ